MSDSEIETRSTTTTPHHAPPRQSGTLTYFSLSTFSTSLKPIAVIDIVIQQWCDLKNLWSIICPLYWPYDDGNSIMIYPNRELHCVMLTWFMVFYYLFLCINLVCLLGYCSMSDFSILLNVGEALAYLICMSYIYLDLFDCNTLFLLHFFFNTQKYWHLI